MLEFAHHLASVLNGLAATHLICSVIVKDMMIGEKFIMTVKEKRWLQACQGSRAEPGFSLGGCN